MQSEQITHALKHVTLILLAGRPGAGKEFTGELLTPRLGKTALVVTSKAIDDFINAPRNGGDEGESAMVKTARSFRESGNNVPDEYVIPIVLARIAELEAEGYTRIILDGFPRNDVQNEEIGKVSSRFVMCYLEIERRIAIERMLKRGRQGETLDMCNTRQDLFERTLLPVVQAFAGRYPSRYLEINSGIHEPEARVAIAHQRILELETTFADA
ncbi:MAG TPA: nucleoside monophosphate kinase [Candidatus Paceibacterota bacterium]|nr:nucleoside monophosphate kinase [Candidatus Paceibacterota bacterium]